MKKLFLTKHASIRCQQRGISEDVAAFIFNYGAKSNTHRDNRFLITKNCINKNFHTDEYFRKFFSKHEKQIKGTAIIVNRDVLITVMKLSKTFKNNVSSLRRHRNQNFKYMKAS